MKAGLSETWREYSRSMTGDNALRLIEKLSLMNFQIQNLNLILLFEKRVESACDSGF